MTSHFSICVFFCAVLFSVQAVDQPVIRVEDNDLYFEVPSKKSISFKASEVKLNGADLLATLNKANNATKLLKNYEAFISEFRIKMEEIENKQISSNVNFDKNITNNDTFLFSVRFRRLANRVTAIQRSVQTIQQLLIKDECASNPCKNGGFCIDIFNGYLCQCPTGWEGLSCDVDINECARFAGTDLGCQNGGTCLNLPGSYQCQCSNGWIGMHCNRKPTDCNSGGAEICGHGTCVPQNNAAGYKCICDPGWTSDGVHPACSVDVDECKQNHPPCSTNPLVQCINLPGSFMCQHCPPGYTGNGYYCADINECEIFNGGCSVAPYVECINNQGSHKCGPCPTGYQGDGRTCTSRGVCSINNGGCNSLANCVHIQAISDSYVQCICPLGYIGSGVGPTGCVRTGSVAPTNACSSNQCIHGTCVPDNSTQGYACVCSAGYSGPLCNQPSNPCSPNPCLNGGTCFTRWNRARCTCLPGFNGRLCQNERQACGEFITGKNGTIKYPPTDFNATRSTENYSCAWTIRTDQDQVIEMNFTKFSLNDAPCTTEWLQIHDGRNSLAPAIGRFCGKTPPLNGSITTTHNMAYFWLRSYGQMRRSPTFEVIWTTKYPACGGKLTQDVGMITSPGWPHNYPNNRECFWRFSVPVNKRVLFHIYSLDIGLNSDCTGDYLEFYTTDVSDLSGSKVSEFAKLCNSTIPSPFYSLFPSGYIHFISNEKDSHNGFQIGYSVVDGIPGCGGIYTSKDGYIQSIQIASSMPSVLLCVYEIIVPVNSTIKLEFVEIDLEENCIDTYVTMYTQSLSGNAFIGKYCGDTIPGPIVTYGDKVLIRSQLKYAYKSHWKIKYLTVCHQTFTRPSDTILIDPEAGCYYLIQQPLGHIIHVEYWPKNTEYRFTMLNYMEFWDGDSENATYLGHFWLNGKIKVESSTNYLLFKVRSFRFLSQITVTYTTTMDLGCGGLLKNDLGTIAYPPQGVEKYEGNKKCRWIIQAPAGKVVQLTWMTFNLEQSFDCVYDNVQIFDNNTEYGLGGSLGKFCGHTLPPVMLSSSNVMTLDFYSDNTFHGDGFLVSFTFIKESNICGGNYFTAAGVIKSPGYPHNYPINRECVWIISVPPGSQIMLKFSNFSLEPYSGCRYDWLEVRNGGTSSSPLVGKYCGNTHPKVIPSHTNKLYIKFVSDTSRTGKGFKIEWTSAATGCGGSLYSPSGSIMSPHYPEPYTKNTDCLWRIIINAGSKIQIIFADIDLERHSTCALDYVQLFDGLNVNSKSLGRFCSPQTSPILSTGNSMLVRFKSDVSFQGRGFNIQYSTICDNVMKGFRGVIESPNFPNDYPQDQNCYWTIQVTEGNKVNISFSHFALERATTSENKSCTFDYVQLEYAPSGYSDTSEIEWEKYNRYCGDNNPGLITLHSNLVRVHFVSDSLLLGSGFRLEWQLFGCGGILTDIDGVIESPNYPNKYPTRIECDWLINVPFGKSISIEFAVIDVEKDSNCNYDFIEIYNGKDDTYQKVATLCHQTKPTTVTSSGNEMFVRFKSDYSYEGRGFHAIYTTISTTCGGLLTAPVGNIFSPNYPKNFNKNETCEWLIDVDENYIIELHFFDVDLVKTWKCDEHYIKVYDGPTQAYPVLETICGNTVVNTNKTIRSTYEHMLVEFRSDNLLTSKGFHAEYKKACGANIKTSGSGQIQFKHEFNHTYTNEEGEPIACTFSIQAEDTSKHVTLTITQLDMGMAWCDETSPAIKIYNGLFNDSAVLGEYCTSKLPPPIVSDGSTLRIDIFKELDFFATYSVLDDHCGGEFHSQEGFLASPGWPKTYPANSYCSWTLFMGPGNTLNLNFIGFDIPESDNCNTDFLEIRESNETGRLLGIFCGKNLPKNISTTGTMHLIFKSTMLEEGIPSSKKGFYAEFDMSMENKLYGQEGMITNTYYPDFNPSGIPGTYSWLITTNHSTIIELTVEEFFIETSMQTEDGCYSNTLKIYDGMDTEAPIIREICSSKPTSGIMSTSNMMYIYFDYYSSRISSRYVFRWKELPKGSKSNKNKNATNSECTESYFFDTQSNMTLSSPGYPHGYAPSLNCEWVFQTPPQSHLLIKILDLNFGLFSSYRVCTYADTVTVYSKSIETKNWEKMGEYCNNLIPSEDIVGSNTMKVEFRTNKYFNGTGFQAKVYAVCGGTLTDPNGVIVFDKDHVYGSDCEWVISVKPRRTIKLNFEGLVFPSDPTCKSYIIIRNGKFADSPFLGIGKYCDSNLPPPDLQSSSNHLYLKYSGITMTKGFKLRYTEVSVECGQDFALSLETTFVEITSPNYPNIPLAHSECAWTFRAPPGESLRIDFEERFDIQLYGTECSTDYVELRDGSTELSPIIGTFCTDMPNTKFTTGNMLRIKYITDSEEPRNGFKAKISISYCGGTYKSAGIISTKDSFTSRAQNNCTWYIKAPLNNRVVISFPIFRVGQHNSNCSSDDEAKITIYEQSTPADSQNVLGTFCGDLNITQIKSSSNELRINYVSRSDKDEFSMAFEFEKEDCGGDLIQESGTILSPGYPAISHENRYCFWRIKVPKGRRISIYMEDVDLDPMFLLIFEGYMEGPKIAGQADIRTDQTYETSDNGARILYWQESPSNKRGFKIRYTSDKPSTCIGDFNLTSGIIPVPQGKPPYRCEYEHTKRKNEETLAVKITLSTNTSDKYRICPRAATGVYLLENNDYIGKACRNTDNRALIFRSTNPKNILIVRQNVNNSLNFTASYNTYNCGGELDDSQNYISSPNFPNEPITSVECTWRIKLLDDVKIRINFSSLDLGENCDNNHVVIYNGKSASHPRIGRYCKDQIPDNSIVSEGSAVLIEYRFEKSDANAGHKGFNLTYELETEGCGGIYHSRGRTIEMPNRNKDKEYKNNLECIWDLIADEGHTIRLSFQGRFYIEDSANCTNDYVELFGWKDESWQSMGKHCGRHLPEDIVSNNNKLRIMFRSNNNITASGFRATWNWNCGGTFEAGEKEQYLTSPGYSYSYIRKSYNNCTYKIVSKKKEGIVRLRFLDFNLGSLNQCAFANLTISGSLSGKLTSPLKQVYCGTNGPSIERFKDAVVITFMRGNRFVSLASGFKLAYKEDSCGGNITAPRAIQVPATATVSPFLTGIYHRPKVSCTWYITAPKNQIPVLLIHNLTMILPSQCLGQFLDIFNGFEAKSRNRLAQICGKIREEKPIPASSNTMLVRLESSAYNFHGFEGEVYFTYGPSAGCGGTINLTDSQFITAPIDLPYMDCHWIIITQEDYKVELEFSDISISNSCENPIRNHTYFCTCSFVEVRDGAGPFSDLMNKLCSTDNNIVRKLTSSWNTAFIRLYSSVSQKSPMFRVHLKAKPSQCGPSRLTATKDMQELTSPGYPNSYPNDLKCTWVITGAENKKIMIHITELNFPEQSSFSTTCEDDRLEIIEDPNLIIASEGYGPNAKHQLNSFGSPGEALKYAFCENETKPFDYYLTGNKVTLKFHSVPSSEIKGKGFKLQYGYPECNRTIYSNEGRIQNDFTGTDKICNITITAEPNRTIALYFLTFYFINHDSTCSKFGLEIRERDSTGPLLLRACGFRLPNPVFSNASQLSLKTYNMLGRPNPYFKYNFIYISSDKGRGCGGKIFNYMGKFSSPMYPEPYRADIQCTWEVTVPKGLKIALKFKEFNIGGGCTKNYVVIQTNSGGVQNDHTLCPEVDPAIMYSDNTLTLTYHSSINNGGTGWMVGFQAVRDEGDSVVWY